ncbi:hypothetical protein V865_006054 [Kwoniella europaea PYCC6329]|uniref:Extracellular membrane protein CFEM domain-containing protein n=1 Tax=Kwoniella europaea PYCC6329 TaxID=1423913 RepID=A0AAX4KN80_9TREE
MKTPRTGLLLLVLALRSARATDYSVDVQATQLRRSTPERTTASPLTSTTVPSHVATELSGVVAVDPSTSTPSSRSTSHAASILGIYESLLDAETTGISEERQSSSVPGIVDAQYPDSNPSGYSTSYKFAGPTGSYTHASGSATAGTLASTARIATNSTSDLAAVDNMATTTDPLPKTSVDKSEASSSSLAATLTSTIGTDELLETNCSPASLEDLTSSLVGDDVPSTTTASTNIDYPGSGVVAYESPSTATTMVGESSFSETSNSLFSSGTVPYGNPTTTSATTPYSDSAMLSSITAMSASPYSDEVEEECIDTSIIPLASSLNATAQSDAPCLSSGGDCQAFVASLDGCQDDNCACELTYQAQLCAQCLSSEEAVQQYNLYLSACSLRGLVQPTETIDAQCGDATGTSDVLTDVLASQAASATSQPTGNAGSTMGGIAAQLPNVSEQAVVATISTTDTNGQPTSIITYLGSTPTSTAFGSVVSQDSAGQSTGTLSSALDSAHTFFSTSVDSTCQGDCEFWLELAQTCTNDDCICMPEALDSAKSCASCVISSNSNDQMNAYAGFTRACITATTGTAALGDSTPVVGMAAVGTSTTPTRGSGGSNPFDTEEASDTGAVKTRMAEHQGGDGIATVLAEDSSASSIGYESSVGGFGWVITGLAGGLMIVLAW